MDADKPAENSGVIKDHSLTPVTEQRRGVRGRTPYSRRLHSSFKSPLQTAERTKLSREEEWSALRRRRQQLQSEIALLEAEGCNVEELELHIDKMHEYNDIKDVGQSLLGRIAALRGTTTRDLYSHFGLDLED